MMRVMIESSRRRNVAKKMLNQTGLMRVLVHLLRKQPDKKVVISEAVVERQIVEELAIFHDPGTKTFTLKLGASYAEKKQSLIIQPNPN